jgi:electron transfer flavoprotein alpha subunit
VEKTGILVVAEPKEGKLANVTLESISKARALASGPVCVVVASNDAAPLAAIAIRYGADKVYVVESPELGVFRPAPFADAAMAAIQAADPALVLCAGSPDGRDIAAALAARLNAGLLVDVTWKSRPTRSSLLIRASAAISSLRRRPLRTSPWLPCGRTCLRVKKLPAPAR